MVNPRFNEAIVLQHTQLTNSNSSYYIGWEIYFCSLSLLSLSRYHYDKNLTNQFASGFKIHYTNTVDIISNIWRKVERINQTLMPLFGQRKRALSVRGCHICQVVETPTKCRTRCTQCKQCVKSCSRRVSRSARCDDKYNKLQTYNRTSTP